MRMLPVFFTFMACVVTPKGPQPGDFIKVTDKRSPYKGCTAQLRRNATCASGLIMTDLHCPGTEYIFNRCFTFEALEKKGQ